MAGRRQGRQSLAALMLLGGAIGACQMSDESAAATTTASAEADAMFALLADFHRGGDPRPALARRGAQFNDTMVKRGKVSFIAPGFAEPGSDYVVRPDGPGPYDTLTIVPAVRVTLDMVATRLGSAKRLPALAGRGWIYSFNTADGARYIVDLTSDPKLPTSRVSAIQALRSR